MKTATVSELKKELTHIKPTELIELCTRLARFKKENKELLTYLIFEAHNESAYIENVKADMDVQFSEIKKHNGLYLIKKTLRKILRATNKYIRYTGSKTAELDLLIYYCNKLKHSGINIHYSTQLTNLYAMQLKKINKALESVHEDLQDDYRKDVEQLLEWI